MSNRVDVLIALAVIGVVFSLATLGVSIAQLARSQTGATAVAMNSADAVFVRAGSRLAIEMAAIGVEETAALAAYRRLSLFAGDLTAIDAASSAPAHGGPLRVARAMAIVHAAMSDAVALATRRYRPYAALDVGFVEPLRSVSVCAAVALAAHDTLVDLYPAQRQRIDAVVLDVLSSVAPDTEGRAVGAELGRATAAAVLLLRQNDGAAHSEPPASEFESSAVGAWRRDPIAQHPIALGARWASLVRPFVIERASQFRSTDVLPAPPPLLSAQFQVELAEVRAVGGDNVTTPTARDAWGTLVGVYWAYDGTGNVCAPPRLYLQLALAAAEQHSLGLVETARLAGSLAITMADAGLAAWDAKYHYRRGRPVTVIRELAAAATDADARWTPLGAPASNSRSPNFTPPFPAYPSGHAVFGGALAQTLRHFLRNDTFTVRFVSSEYDGVTRDNTGALRPFVPRDFSSATQIESENADSRIKLGIHWRADGTNGIAQGRAVAEYTLARLFPTIASN
jgi:PAP2 superfamily